ncbi:MAG: SPOR domain-containing protein [Chitinispirillaceae bacterium]|jgi:hypothetical protein|nr:SPOR domain-containing protein [Chitinispirillaceae bacterium]
MMSFTVRAAAVFFFSATVLLAGARNDRAPETILDTINKGREVAISAGDFAPVVSNQESDAPEPAADPVPAASNREAGVVPSRFKIQILAATSQEQVSKEKRLLAEKTELPLSLVFDSPYHKLFAGDFSLRSEAESALVQIKSLGYSDAWIVRMAKPRQ